MRQKNIEIVLPVFLYSFVSPSRPNAFYKSFKNAILGTLKIAKKRKSLPLGVYINKMHILLVDDERELTAPLSVLLTREGYRVDVVDDGLRGSEMAFNGDYDLLILDWMLPGKTGLEICQELRSRQENTPVLFLTAKDTIDDRVLGLDSGADDYLVKPFELRELLARVRALLRRPPTLELGDVNNILQVGDLELDVENQVAYRGGKRLIYPRKNPSY